MPTEKPRFTITMDQDLYDRVNAYQHDNKMNSQTKAIIDLINKGIKMELGTVFIHDNHSVDLSPAALSIARRYDALDDHSKKVVEALVDLELKRPSDYASETARFNKMSELPSTESSAQ